MLRATMGKHNCQLPSCWGWVKERHSEPAAGATDARNITVRSRICRNRRRARTGAANGYRNSGAIAEVRDCENIERRGEGGSRCSSRRRCQLSRRSCPPDARCGLTGSVRRGSPQLIVSCGGSPSRADHRGASLAHAVGGSASAVAAYAACRPTPAAVASRDGSRGADPGARRGAALTDVRC